MSVTIKDLAKETGLTPATISAYFNGGNVRDYNKAKIEEAIEKLGYIRNDFARGLRTHKSRTIGVLLPEIANKFSTSIISETEESLRMKGYGIIVCDCRSSVKREKEAIRFLLSKMVDGLIVIPEDTSANACLAAAQNGVPVVAVDRRTGNPALSHAVINNREASKNAVNMLIERGAKEIAAICGDLNVYTAGERFAGYCEAMKEAGLEENITYANGAFSVQGGYDAAKKVLEGNPAQALFVSNYEMSVGAVMAAKDMGIIAGGDIGFMGFDDIDYIKPFCPGILGVRQPIKELGRVAAETIISMIDGGPARNIVLNAEIR